MLYDRRILPWLTPFVPAGMTPVRVSDVVLYVTPLKLVVPTAADTRVSLL